MPSTFQGHAVLQGNAIELVNFMGMIPQHALVSPRCPNHVIRLHVFNRHKSARFRENRVVFRKTRNRLELVAETDWERISVFCGLDVLVQITGLEFDGLLVFLVRRQEFFNLRTRLGSVLYHPCFKSLQIRFHGTRRCTDSSIDSEAFQHDFTELCRRVDVECTPCQLIYLL